MGHRMPQELIDMVLYTFDTSCERETLKSCSLTCRAWLPASRARLFECVQFGHPKDILSFSGILRQSPCLACYVRTLEIVAFDERVPYSDEDLDALRTIVASMDRVQCLYLTGDAIDGFPFLDCLPRMESVLELNINHAYFDDIGSYTGLFATLPNVEEVDIDTISVPMPDDEPIPLLVIAPKLRRVRLDGCLGAYAPLLPSALDHLIISFSNPRDLRQFCSVLHQSNAASSLTGLAIDDMTGLCDDGPEPYEVDDSEPYEVDDSEPYEGLLRRCTALRYFSFHGSLLWAISMMQSAPDSVTKVILYLPQDSMGGFRHLATALNCERLPHLERVVVYLRNSETPGDFDATELPTIFPDLHDRGIWKLEWWDR